ncbi:helix-hairpin-helix domain-containing protein [Verminephrobacter eiseniae]|uniref:ComEA family DNA-binding protein n=1 Tax=Verminephrobacter eiseniae TaxID=364317 RepID=UPI0022372410|nr:helix-hairpin-helix domain-containing protein [Verminephrobacter eiseniae]MCW5259942.1 helix-hairpin-helix domain-containing protein [Verminephrobacter eiseniae]
MLKKILFIIAMLYAAASFAAVDANKASAAELEGIKGIGPSLSGKIVEERKSGPFKDWDDFVRRVGGVGKKSAAKFSHEGLTVDGKKFDAAKAATKADPKADHHAKKGADGKKDAAPTAKTPGGTGSTAKN